MSLTPGPGFPPNHDPPAATSPSTETEDAALPTSDHDRLVAYRYLVEPARADYIAIMRVFTATLLADMSAHEVAERLAHNRVDLPVETVAQRLEQLKQWGALLSSSRPVKAASVAEYQRSRGRYRGMPCSVARCGPPPECPRTGCPARCSPTGYAPRVTIGWPASCGSVPSSIPRRI
ncbi:DUF2397 family protein [Lipingzhangella sp. LS1_29]|uniref:DUF2397 family protein n=1 Tax=Lipingzhangella rawalii TaxID=2055835 RepID=A0ABU2H619_9ACTN|nr:DUF2397 family protein [Lipingzhangella rawalii]MDS1270742.1 DUF2397 family protein [Lipingzhangella rawalii]